MLQKLISSILRFTLENIASRKTNDLQQRTLCKAKSETKVETEGHVIAQEVGGGGGGVDLCCVCLLVCRWRLVGGL